MSINEIVELYEWLTDVKLIKEKLYKSTASHVTKKTIFFIKSKQTNKNKRKITEIQKKAFFIKNKF